MPHPSDYVLETIDKLDSPEVLQHLVHTSLIPTQYADLSVAERTNRIVHGYTNHPAFEHLYMLNYTYILKPFQSASKALKDAMEKYQMVIDCANAVKIIGDITLLKTMIALYGEDAGSERFDAIFGSNKFEVPTQHRLKIVHPTTYASQIHIQHETKGNVAMVFPHFMTFINEIKCDNVEDLKKS